MLSMTTALRNAIATTTNVKAALDGGFFYFYDGPIPASAAAGININENTLLCLMSADGGGDIGNDGLIFESTPSNGVLAKDANQVWKGQVLANGTPTFGLYIQNPAADYPDAPSDIHNRFLVSAGGLGNMVAFQTLPWVANGSNEQGIAMFGIQVGY